MCQYIPSGKAVLFDSLVASLQLEFTTKEDGEPAGRQLHLYMSRNSTHAHIGIMMKPPPVGVMGCSQVL